MALGRPSPLPTSLPLLYKPVRITHGVIHPCTEALDLAPPKGKVAWDPDGRRIAFAIPQGAVRDGARFLWRGKDDQDRAGVFVLDRQNGTLARVEDSQDARRLTFPEFVGRNRILFLLPQEAPGGQSRFRLVCCLR